MSIQEFVQKKVNNHDVSMFEWKILNLTTRSYFSLIEKAIEFSEKVKFNKNFSKLWKYSIYVYKKVCFVGVIILNVEELSIMRDIIIKTSKEVLKCEVTIFVFRELAYDQCFRCCSKIMKQWGCAFFEVIVERRRSIFTVFDVEGKEES